MNLMMALGAGNALYGHCQLPCGIYDNDLIFNYVNQYIETMQKACDEIETLKTESAQDRAQFVRWVVLKDDESNKVADLVTSYFLQQVIKPEKEDTNKKVMAVYGLLQQLAKIKQTANVDPVNKFLEMWREFVLMFQETAAEKKS